MQDRECGFGSWEQVNGWWWRVRDNYRRAGLGRNPNGIWGPSMLDWDLALVAIAGYVAVMSLVRLLQKHRQIVLRELQQQVDLEQRRQEIQRRPQTGDGQESKTA